MQIFIKLIISSILLISLQLNVQDFQQTTINSGLPDLGNSHMVWGDFDQDGDSVVLLSGTDDLIGVTGYLEGCEILIILKKSL